MATAGGRGDGREVHIAANNNHAGYAPRTAEWLTRALIAAAERQKTQEELPLVK